MATPFNPADAVEQQPEVENNMTFKVEGYEGEQTVQEAQEQRGNEEAQAEAAPEAPTTEAGTDEIGVERIVEDSHPTQEQEEIQTEGQASEEIIDIIDIDETGNEPAQETENAGLPEWVQNLVNFTEDTGGGLEEYLNYTKDTSSLSDMETLKEYYKITKPHYSNEDIDLYLEENFGIDEDYYEEGEELSREDKLKKMAVKDELLKAEGVLSANKEKYYADLKSGVNSAPEQYKDAVEFYDKSQKSQKEASEWRDNFIDDSKKVLNEDFSGFTFDTGDQKFRLSAGDPGKLLDRQSDINTVLGEFLDGTGKIADVEGYHKALWTAQNADKIFKAAFEQGKSAALTERAKSTKNPSYEPNSGQSESPKRPGIKFLDQKW